MKKLSIEEKAKRYDEAIKKARNIVNSINVGLIGKNSFEAVFPELKESEDERIRKRIIHALHGDVLELSEIKEAVDWLEKQGEKGTKGNDMEIPFDAWSEDDDEHLGRILKELENQRQRPFNRPYLDKIESDCNWLKFLKDRVQLQPVQGWSNEDSVRLKRIIDFLRHNRKGDTDAIYQQEQDIDWLKSLEFQKKWKPSEKQINALRDVLSLRDIKYDILYELLECLKKLK